MSQNTKPKAPKGAKHTLLSGGAITDSRFRNIETDPRFRLPSKRTTHVKLDKRFAHMLRDDDFSKKASVDRYGRMLPKNQGRKELERMYVVDEGREHNDGSSEVESGEDDEIVRRELARVERRSDPAREGGFSESSSDEESEEDEEEEDIEAEDGMGEGVGRLEEEEIPMGDVTTRIAVVNLDWDNVRSDDIMAVASSFCPPQGNILKVSIYPSEYGRERMEREELEGPAPEHFGKHRTNGYHKKQSNEPDEEEDLDESDDSTASEKIKSSLLARSTAEAPEVESRALRAYQLSRLRYYYAVIKCDSIATASSLYEAMDGREYLSSANFFDVRFIPESVTFDDPVADKPRDECERVPAGYKPKEFVTEALRHSKVRLTWDEDDPGRKEVQKRAFSRKEIDENDLMAYVASDSESENDDEEIGAIVQETDLQVPGASGTNSVSKTSKSLTAREKLRAALGLSSEPAPTSQRKKHGDRDRETSPALGGMQVTFTAGIASEPATRGAVFQNRPEDVHQETTREKYIRKERERKARRKERAQARREGRDPDADSEGGSAENEAIPTMKEKTKSILNATNDKDSSGSGEEDDPFNDPFFADPTTANKTARKAAKVAKRAAAAAETEASALQKQRERAELELLMAGDDDAAAVGAGRRGFNMAEIKRAEKDAAKNGKKGKKGSKSKAVGNNDEAKDTFEVDTADPRFKALYESHEFAIDPSNARFSGTKVMKDLLEHGRRKRGKKSINGATTEGDVKERSTNEGKRRADDDLDVLVSRIKKKR